MKPSDIIKTLLPIMHEAGAAILKWQQQDFAVMKKGENDILTHADLEANDILKTRLNAAFPTDGWLSEESADDLTRLNCERVWIIDPIDGTREFATRVPEYAISVALVERGEPIVAAVYNPATEQLFHAVKAEGAWCGKQRLHCRQPHERLLLLASRSEYRRGEWTRFEKMHDVQVIGSIAYKLALIAAGFADATFSLGPKSEWDIAAGVLLVSEAGGNVSNKQQQKIVFNQANVLVNGIVASSKESNQTLFNLIEHC